MISTLIDIVFLLLLVSGLLAGGWSFYKLVYKEINLLSTDLFIVDTMQAVEDGFKSISERLNTLETSHAETIAKIEQVLKNIEYEK